MDPKDRRRHPRFEQELSVDLLNMGDDPSVTHEAIVPAIALDVSRSGLRLKANYNVPVGSILSVIAYYRNHESICLCEVVWKREAMSEKLYGLYIKEWSKLDPVLERKLKDMESASTEELHNSDPTPTAHAVVTQLA